MVSILFLGGCWDRSEINDMAIVTAAAIDKLDGQSIELTLQLFIPKALGGGSGSGGGAPSGGQQLTFVRSGKGLNIADAASKLQARLPRRIFWGHCKVFILGEAFAREGVKEEMDYLFRHPQPRERAFMFVSQGQAAEMLRPVPPLERYTAEVARELSEQKIGIRVTLKEFLEMLDGEGQAAALPYLRLQPPQKGEKKNQSVPFIAGTAVFKRDKMNGLLTMRTTRGALWLRKEIQKASITVRLQGTKREFITMTPIRQRIEIKPRIHDGQWIIHVHIHTVGDLVQNGTNLDPMNPDLLHLMEQAVQRSIADRVEEALDRLQRNLNADIIGFGESFHRAYPKPWRQARERWDELFPKVQVRMDIRVNIRRPGLGSVPAAVPSDEVKEK